MSFPPKENFLDETLSAIFGDISLFSSKVVSKTP